jgi:hypothetical protein
MRDTRWLNRWGVCTGYELRPSPRGGLDDYYQRDRRPDEYYLAAKYPLQLASADDEHWKTYKPLEEQPDLFLRFARLSRQDASPQRALDWCKEYGVLGLAGDHHWGWAGENKARRAYESLGAFDAEVNRAAGVLALYEAALNRDREAAEYYACEKYPQISAELWASGVEQELDPSFLQEMVQTHTDGDYLAYALEAASWIVESTVRELCYPTLWPEGSSNPSDVSGGWGFRNLRGAMYLQMYWLMAAGGNSARCKQCGGMIYLSSPLPGARKPRQDKKFCDDACRQRHHYHNTTKPRRRANLS